MQTEKGSFSLKHEKPERYNPPSPLPPFKLSINKILPNKLLKWKKRTLLWAKNSIYCLPEKTLQSKLEGNKMP